MMNINPLDQERYARQILLPELGEAGQLLLASSSALLIGCGGLGSPVSLYLAAAGVGRIGLVEFDILESSNLQRQILHSESSLGLSKLDSAVARLQALNSQVKIDAYEGRFSPSMIHQSYDVIIDASDNFATRVQTNAYAYERGTPYVVAAVSGFIGQVSVFQPPYAPCYQCHLGAHPPVNTSPIPIMGAVAGAIGAMEALEAIKILSGMTSSLVGKILEYNLWTHRQRILTLAPNSDCLICGK